MNDDFDIDIPERPSSRHRMRKDDWEKGLLEHLEEEKDKKTDISEASLPLEKVGVLVFSLMGVIGTAVTAWIGVNQHMSTMASDLSALKVTSDSKFTDMNEKLSDLKSRIAKAEDDIRKVQEDNLTHRRETSESISELKDSIRKK